jgi:hypothetical protein
MDSMKPKPMTIDLHLEFDPASTEAFRLVRRAKKNDVDPIEMSRAIASFLGQHGLQGSKIKGSSG